MPTDVNAGQGLYAKLLGDSWSRLHPAVRRFHDSNATVHARGLFRVRHGSNWLVRAFARLARLPAAGERIAVNLFVSPQGRGELWRRRFASKALASYQFARRDGLLVERVGCLELRFHFHEVDGALIYETVSAALCHGLIHVPLPSLLAPRISAWEKFAGADQQIES